MLCLQFFVLCFEFGRFLDSFFGFGFQLIGFCCCLIGCFLCCICGRFLFFCGLLQRFNSSGCSFDRLLCFGSSRFRSCYSVLW